MSETSKTRELTKMLLQRRGVESYPLIASQWTPPGWPDRLLSHESFGLCLVEFKDFRTPTSPLQMRRLKNLQRACIVRFSNPRESDSGNTIRLETIDRYTEWFDPLKLPEMLKVLFA